MSDTRPGARQNTASGDAAAGGRLLIIDDVFDNRAILARRFERRGFEIMEADSGAKGLELIAQHAFDAVLLDWMMPDMDGPEVLQRIRQQHSDVALPVIMVTAKSQSEDVVQALTQGANDYITKPVDFAVALARVQTQVGRKRAEQKVWEANEALARSNEELERRVADRTVELVETNARLRVAIDEAEAANRAKDEFLANMSHELRTPLNGVIGMAQMLATTALTAHQQEMIAVINGSAEGLQAVVSDLLDIVDLTSGRSALAPQPFALGELVNDVAAGCEQRAKEKGLAFRAEVAADAAGQVETDPGRLRQVLTNLLANAVKFTDAGEVSLSVERTGDRVAFIVRDTGVGFDDETAERLFRRFEQADGSLTRRFGGVGLGLAICRELIQQMGGTITASGRPNEGATFRVELPLPAEGAAAAASQDASVDPGSLHVLCVEDHPVNRKVIEFIMDAAGVKLTAVENGAVAVDVYKTQTFDAVLMDMQMPVMDGLAATRAIRQFEVANGRRATPILMVTAHGFPEHVAASRAAGADKHVTKPVNPTELLRAILELASPGARLGDEWSRSA